MRSDVARQLGALALASIQVDNPMLLVRVASWSNSLGRVGLSVPLSVIHDVGLMLSIDTEAPKMREGAMSVAEAAFWSGAYLDLLRELAETELVQKAKTWKLDDQVVSVLLLRLLGPLVDRWRAQRGSYPVGQPIPLDPTLLSELGPQLDTLWRTFDRSAETSFVRFLVEARLQLLTLFERIDLDTLKILGLFGTEAVGMDALDLLNVLESPEANDIVNFSLEIIPSVLETKRATGMQTFAVDGYAGLMRSGHLDHLLLSELAYPDDLFEQRYLENELFYYAREREQGEERRLHYIVIDASASMRGVRQVFARGLALTLIKKLTLRGEEIVVRFFDSRLHDVVRVRGGAVNVPYLLCFKSEMGRNYRRVFQQLALDLQRTLRSQRRQAVLYILTHAECHIPIDVVERLRKIAFLYGVFILPSSGDVELDYVDLLGRVQVVDKGTLDVRSKRAERALEIVDDAVRVSAPPPARPRPADER
jgi:hypothetical protein